MSGTKEHISPIPQKERKKCQMNNLQIFKNADFGEIRTVTIKLSAITLMMKIS